MPLLAFQTTALQSSLKHTMQLKLLFESISSNLGVTKPLDLCILDPDPGGGSQKVIKHMLNQHANTSAAQERSLRSLFQAFVAFIHQATDPNAKLNMKPADRNNTGINNTVTHGTINTKKKVRVMCTGSHYQIGHGDCKKLMMDELRFTGNCFSHGFGDNREKEYFCRDHNFRFKKFMASNQS